MTDWAVVGPVICARSTPFEATVVDNVEDACSYTAAGPALESWDVAAISARAMTVTSDSMAEIPAPATRTLDASAGRRRVFVDGVDRLDCRAASLSAGAVSVVIFDGPRIVFPLGRLVLVFALVIVADHAGIVVVPDRRLVDDVDDDLTVFQGRQEAHDRGV